MIGRATPMAPAPPASTNDWAAAGVTLTFDPPLAIPPISVTPTNLDPAVLSVTAKVWAPASAVVKV